MEKYIFKPWFTKHANVQTDETAATWGLAGGVPEFYDTVDAELEKKGIKIHEATAADMDGCSSEGRQQTHFDPRVHDGPRVGPDTFEEQHNNGGVGG